MGLYVVTGGGGFIGSNLARSLVSRGDSVRILDDFSTGKRSNLVDLEGKVEVVEGSICDIALLCDVMRGADYCLHQAAIPSVPRSVQDPLGSNRVNVEGSLAVFLAARDAGVKRVVCASSSSVYGSSVETPTSESSPLNPISPYGVSKATGEMYARVCSDLYDLDVVSLRYFNVFGPWQDPESAYAAVVPIFTQKLLDGESPDIHGDGGQSRDFSYIDNVVEANLAACGAEGKIAGAYNIACGASTSVLELFHMISELLGVDIEPNHTESRPGDIRESYADISLAQETFGYSPKVAVREGLEQTVGWYRDRA